jgi:hypothetical protein
MKEPNAMIDPEEQQAIDRVKGMIYQAVRAAMADELMIYHAATVVPMINLLIEMQQLLKSIADGQILVERHLADLAPPDEPWKESLD